MNTKLVKRRILIIILAQVLVILACLPLFSKIGSSNKDISFQETGYTDESGKISFVDKDADNTIDVLVKDRASQTPLQHIRVEVLTNATRVFVLVFDEDGKYIPRIYEGPISSEKSYFGISNAKAQGPLATIEILLDYKSYFKTAADLASLLITDRPIVEDWNWRYHDECWTHEQLVKSLGIQLKELELSLDLIFPSKSLKAIPKDQEFTKLLLKGIRQSAGEVMGQSDPYAGLPDPLRLRISHIPTIFPVLAIQYIGECTDNQVTPPAKGGFATLIAESTKTTNTTNTISTQPPTNFPQVSQLNSFKIEDSKILYNDAFGDMVLINPNSFEKDILYTTQAGTLSAGSVTCAKSKPICIVIGGADNDFGIQVFNYQTGDSQKWQNCGFGCTDNEIYISPNGEKIIYLQNTASEVNSYFVANIDGKNSQKLMELDYGFFGYAERTSVAWSPNNKHIVYEYFPPQGPTSLNIINVDGTGQKRLYTNKVIDSTTEDYIPFYPTWSPDGQQIAFNINNSFGGIYKINADGSGLTLLSEFGWRPSWSPDGGKILFYGCKFANDPDLNVRFSCYSIYDLFIMNPDGSDLTQLTKDPDTAGNPTDGGIGQYAFHAIWSPDGKWIAFNSDRDKVKCAEDQGSGFCAEIFIMNADGTNLKKITVEPSYKYLVDWLP